MVCFVTARSLARVRRRPYFVRCDSTTTTPFDVANGFVNVALGIAPIKPAEFIILQIRQVAARG